VDDELGHVNSTAARAAARWRAQCRPPYRAEPTMPRDAKSDSRGSRLASGIDRFRRVRHAAFFAFQAARSSVTSMPSMVMPWSRLLTIETPDSQSPEIDVVHAPARHVQILERAAGQVDVVIAPA